MQKGVGAVKEGSHLHSTLIYFSYPCTVVWIDSIQFFHSTGLLYTRLTISTRGKRFYFSQISSRQARDTSDLKCNGHFSSNIEIKAKATYFLRLKVAYSFLLSYVISFDCKSSKLHAGCNLVNPVNGYIVSCPSLASYVVD